MVRGPVWEFGGEDMARFNSVAYDKLYPRTQEPVQVETAVPTFTPTANKLEGKDPDQVADDPAEQAKKDVIIQEPAPEIPEEVNVADGHAEHSEPDS